MVKIKIKKTTKKSFLVNVFLSIISILALMTNNIIIEFMAITLLFIVIVWYARISYFSVFSFIMWFSFLQEFFAAINPALSTGRLKWDTSVPIYYQELYICLIYFYIFELFLFSISNVLLNEKIIYKQRINISKKVAYIYALASLFFVLLAYPSIPSMNSLLSRDQGVLSSTLFVPIAMLLLATTFDYWKKSNFFKIIAIIDIIWIILHGDRVIVLGFVVYLVIKYMNFEKIEINKIKNKLFNKRTLIVLTGMIAIIFLSLRVQTTRMGEKFQFSISSFLLSILKQGTAADVVHCFNCATDMWKSGNAVHGYTYLSYISNILPRANNAYSPSMILMEKYNTLGGGLFFAEPMMNGGIIVCFIHSSVFLLTLTWLFSKKTSYRSFLIIPFIILIFRFAWYASLAGLVKMLLYYVPFIYYIAKRVK